MTHGRSQPGLTLIELLAALALLAVFTAALSTLAVATTGTAQRVDRVARGDQLPARAIELLRRDLDEAWPGSVAVDLTSTSISLVTTHSLSAEAPGWAKVTWRLSDDPATLLRTRSRLRPDQGEADSVTRPVLRRATSLSIEPAGDEPLAPLSVTIIVEGGASASVTIARPEEPTP